MMVAGHVGIRGPEEIQDTLQPEPHWFISEVEEVENKQRRWNLVSRTSILCKIFHMLIFLRLLNKVVYIMSDDCSSYCVNYMNKETGRATPANPLLSLDRD